MLLPVYVKYAVQPWSGITVVREQHVRKSYTTKESEAIP